jgi:TrmH family RNA methyltransferase
MSFDENLITSLQNTRIKQVVKLRDRRGRQLQGRIVIDGLREILHALAGDVHCAEAYVCPDLVASPEAEAVLRELDSRQVVRVDVSVKVWDKINFGNRQDGILVVAVPPERTLDGLTSLLAAGGDAPLILVLDGVEKPGNIGAVCRTADASGVFAVILTDARTDLFNPNAIRASLGTIFRVPIVAAATQAAQRWLMQHQFQSFIARVDGEVEYDQVDLTQRCAVVLGSEASGVGPLWQSVGNHDDPRRTSQTPIRLPMLGTADSLNVSITAAVLSYEALRQKRLKGLA